MFKCYLLGWYAAARSTGDDGGDRLACSTAYIPLPHAHACTPAVPVPCSPSRTSLPSPSSPAAPDNHSPLQALAANNSLLLLDLSGDGVSGDTGMVLLDSVAANSTLKVGRALADGGVEEGVWVLGKGADGAVGL